MKTNFRKIEENYRLSMAESGLAHGQISWSGWDELPKEHRAKAHRNYDILMSQLTARKLSGEFDTN